MLASIESTKTTSSDFEHSIPIETDWFTHPFRLARKKNNMVAKKRIDAIF
jgi:hypothetical protein